MGRGAWVLGAALLAVVGWLSWPAPGGAAWADFGAPHGGEDGGARESR